MTLITNLNKPYIFHIDESVRQKFPSLTIGIAIIRGVRVAKLNTELLDRINKFVKSQAGLTNEIISSYPEVQSYRKVYKEMSVDWHSRRPSPEALLRRISKGKSLYQINTCVDAYNLVVLKNRISSGAFDLDKIKFPTTLRLTRQGEKILLLGDSEQTEFKPTELAYFDQEGAYNIDLNYRDAQRTAVTENTKNLLINIDGIYEISRNQVKKTLDETIQEITRYCGGQVEEVGIISA